MNKSVEELYLQTDSIILKRALALLSGQEYKMLKKGLYLLRQTCEMIFDDGRRYCRIEIVKSDTLEKVRDFITNHQAALKLEELKQEWEKESEKAK